MIHEILCYKTPDGKIFESEKKAEEHLRDLAGEVLERHLKSVLPEGKYSRSDLFKFMMAIVGEGEKTQKLVEDLYNIFG